MQTGLWVNKPPVPTPSVSVSFSYCPNSNYETVVATSCLPCNAYASASVPPPHHMRMPQSNQQHKRSFSLHLPPFQLFLFFHCCDLAVVPCSCHSLLHAATVGELLAVHTCNQIAAPPPDLRLACGLGNFIVPSRTGRTRRTNTKSAAKQFNDSGVLHLKHAWSARCGGLDKLVNTF